MMICKRFVQVLGGLCLILCLTACTNYQPREQTSSPEVAQTQAVSHEVENTQGPEAADQESTLSEGTEDTDIPDESVEFGD